MTQAPEGHWSGDADRWALSLAGDWRGQRAVLPSPPEALARSEAPARLTLE